MDATQAIEIFSKYPECVLSEFWKDEYYYALIPKEKTLYDSLCKIVKGEDEHEYGFMSQHRAIQFANRLHTHLNVGNALLNFPFPHLLKRLVREACKTYNKFGKLIMSVANVYGKLNALRSFKRLFIQWHRSATWGVLIARNRADNLPDIRVSIKYRPQIDEYFAVAFSGKFKKDLEDGCLVIQTKRVGTTQEVVQIFCQHKLDPVKAKKMIHQLLDRNKSSLEELEAAMQTIFAASTWDPTGCFASLAQDYLIGYVNTTLYNKGLASKDRLLRFTTDDPVLAEYVWSSSFNTEKKRFALIGDLEIAVRDHNKLLRANSVSELQKLIHHKISCIRNQRSSIYDDLPPHIWKMIKDAEQKHKQAVAGTPVGFRGVRYYSSEDIDATRNLVKQAWIKADQWIGKNRRTNKVPTQAFV